MTASDRLTAQLSALLDADDRPPCCWPDVAPWWLSDAHADRARAAEHCHGCAILDACRDAADENGERFGVWAGRDRTPKPRKPKGKPKPATPKPAALAVCRGCSATFAPRRGGQQWCRQACRTKAASAERRRRARDEGAS